MTEMRMSLADNCRELKPLDNPAKVVRLKRSGQHKNPALENVAEFYDRVQVGWRVKELRTASGHTIPGLSERLRMSRIVLAYIERGTRHVNVEVLRRIVGYYGVSVEWLCYGTEEDDGDAI